MATTTTTPRIRITSEGNVGIGTNAPLQRLHVSGNVTVDAESAYRIGNVDTFNEVGCGVSYIPSSSPTTYLKFLYKNRHECKKR